MMCWLRQTLRVWLVVSVCAFAGITTYTIWSHVFDEPVAKGIAIVWTLLAMCVMRTRL